MGREAGTATESGGIKHWLVSVRPAVGKSKSGQFLGILASSFLFLWAPDVDLAFLELLHHRSVVTHSLLPAIVVLMLARNWGVGLGVGALVGTSVHLSADIVTPSMTGFAQVWLPEPWQIPLGPLSYLWLFANAAIGFALASLVARNCFGRRAALPVIFVCATLAGAVYGWSNERSILSIAVIWVTILVSLWPERRIGRAF